MTQKLDPQIFVTDPQKKLIANYLGSLFLVSAGHSKISMEESVFFGCIQDLMMTLKWMMIIPKFVDNPKIDNNPKKWYNLIKSDQFGPKKWSNSVEIREFF